MARGARLPTTGSESLAGSQVVLPDSMEGHPSVVVIGFSKSSQDGVKAWDERARKELGAGFDVYPVAVLEDAPRLVRGIIIHAMKGSIPAARQDHFLIVVKGEAELKRATLYSAADDAYVLLLDRGGEIRWRIHGAVSDAAIKELRGQLDQLK
jgi:ATP10 protein